VLFDLSLAVEVRDAGVLVGAPYRAVNEVTDARGLGRVGRGDPVARLCFHTGLEGGGHDVDGVHAPSGLLYGGRLFEVAFCQFRTEALEFFSFLGVRPADECSYSMSFIQKHPGKRAALLSGSPADQHRKKVRHS
jgi:hypothetical protein